MTGIFIVSLDCEGKWGMADHLEPYHHRLLTDRTLAAVYDQLVELFARYDIPATFAYVMAFTLSEAERKELSSLLLEDKARSSDSWMRHYWDSVRCEGPEGWFQPHALDAVRVDGRHEIACHSFCHRPMGEGSLTREEAEAEIAAAQRVAAMKGLALRTFIYPRNEVGHVDVLRRNGFIGYREKLARPAGAVGRVLRLAEEFHVWPAPQPRKQAAAGDIVRIPAGRFFNWRFGARKRIPLGVTVARWTSLLNRTARHGGVAHLWLHPHNLITGPDTAQSFDAVLAHAAKLRDSGRLRVMTQQAYCEDMLGQTRVPSTRVHQPA